MHFAPATSRFARIMIALAAIALIISVVPGASADPGDATLNGVVTDSTTGLPFPASGDVLAVDLIRTSDRHREVAFMTSDGTGAYTVADVSPGTYRLRYRYFAAAGPLFMTRYQWYTPTGPVTNYDDAADLVFATSEVKAINEALVPIVGGTISGTITDRTTSGPPTLPGCQGVFVYEASGIGLGYIPTTASDGTYVVSSVPDGEYKALVYEFLNSTAPCDNASPVYLDKWYGGGEGGDLAGDTAEELVAHPILFSTGDTFTVLGGATGIDVGLRPVPLCDGLQPTIIGTSVGDTLDGTSGDDVIVALQGADTVRGLGGNDTICAGKGGDTVRGGSGDDRIFGRRGADVLRGGPGNDFIKGGRGSDEIRGGGGNDDLYGNRGNDTIFGGGGTDTANGGNGLDACTAESETNCE